MLISRSLLVSCVVAASAASSHAATLIHHYTFDSDVTDTAGSSNGTLENGATVTGGMLVLNAANSQYVSFLDNLIPTSGTFTVAFFAQETQHFSNYVELISQGSSGSSFYLGYNPSNGMRGGDQWGITGANFPLDGLSHHYAYVNSATDTLLYIDGQLVATRGAPIGSIALGTPTRFGRQYNGHAEYYTGSMDDVRIYSDPLTPTEINNLIPEPASLSLITLCGLTLLRRRR